jgi:hypothetical protein
MAYTNILKSSILMNIQMNWQNVQHMDERERKLLIKEVVNFSTTRTSFVLHGAKFHLAHIIHHSEPYFNKTGTQTKVKEFDALGWYDEKGNLDFNKINRNP